MKSLTINLLIVFFALQSYAGSITVADITVLYQPQEKIETLKNELAFWQKKSNAAPNQQTFKVQLANAHSALFDATAEIQHLKKAEYLLGEVRDYKTTNPANTYRALAHNFISQHRFCEAMDLVVTAYDLGSNRRASELMLFDLYEELGDEPAQRSLLQKLSDQKDFNYIIRLAKWEDGQGRLDRTIALMKKAELIAESSQQTGRKIWVYTNLADYYGHAGEIMLSKEYYMKALALNPADWYSMKGLAWIAYSHDNNPDAAIDILQHISSTSADPGIKGLQAEILEFKGQTKKASVINKKIAEKVSQADYGDMYNGFLCEYFLSAKGKTEQAMMIAQKELLVRATPQAYDLQAQVLFATGDIDGAKQISKAHIWNHTFEPHILKSQLKYFKGSTDPYLQKITEEIGEARYELGPLHYKNIFGES